MIDTGGTLGKAVSMIKDKGAKRVYCFATHGFYLIQVYFQEKLYKTFKIH